MAIRVKEVLYKIKFSVLLEEASEGFLEEALKQGSTGWVEFGFGYAENGDGHSRIRGGEQRQGEDFIACV